MMVFRNRKEAGLLLAYKLARYQQTEPIIYALPRGGVVLAAEVAVHLMAPLDLIITRKVGHPGNPEYAVAAVTENGEIVANEAEVSSLDPTWFKQAAAAQIAEAKRRRLAYAGGGKSLSGQDRTAIVIDDGIATGLTMLAAIKALRAQQTRQVVVAVPVIPADVATVLQAEGSEVVALETPQQYLGSVGAYYTEFEQVQDGEVIRLLQAVRQS